MLKQYLAGKYEGTVDGFERILRSQPRVNRKTLQELAPEQVDAWPVWSGLGPWLADFVHGGLVSCPNGS